MKYLILIFGNPATREIWAGFSPEQRAEGFRVYAQLADDLIASGELIVTEALTDPSQAVRVPADEGQSMSMMSTDGPFAEAKEQLAGFFLVQCESMERALEIAALVPEAPLGMVEVRPVLELGGTDM